MCNNIPIIIVNVHACMTKVYQGPSTNTYWYINWFGNYMTFVLSYIGWIWISRIVLTTTYKNIKRSH